MIGDRLTILDDEKTPVEGTLRDLELGTDFIFCKNALSLPAVLEPRGVTPSTEADLLAKTSFTCTECTKSFSRAQYLRRHQFTDHTVHRCNDCEEFFFTSSLLCAHIENKHVSTEQNFNKNDKVKKGG